MPDFEEPIPAIPHVILLLDASSSMIPSRATTISAVNEYVEGLRGKLPAEALVSAVAFTSNATYSFGIGSVIERRAERILHPIFQNVPLGRVAPVTEAQYEPGGNTPLLDALGQTIEQLEQRLFAQPGPVFVAVLTDGEENASRKFTKEVIKGLVDKHTAEGWTFTFIGVDIDAYGQGAQYGFAAGSTVSVARATMAGATASLSANIGRKYAASTTMDRATYATWNVGDATFSDEEKKTLERKDP